MYQKQLTEDLTALIGDDGQIVEIRDAMGNTIMTLGGTSTPTTPDWYTTLDATSVTTSATPTGGATVAFPAAPCNGMIVKADLVEIEYQRNGTGAFYRIRPYEIKYIYGITDASQIAFRRVDYASARTTQTTKVRATLINTNTDIACTSLNVAVPNNSTYAAFPSFACTHIEVTNLSTKDVYLKKDAGTDAIPLRKHESMLIAGITNANQISVVGHDSQSGGSVYAEAFQAMPSLPTREYTKALLLDPSTRIYLGEQQAGNRFATVGQLQPFTKYAKKGKTITLFNTAANAVFSGTGGGSITNTALAGDETFGTWSANAQFGAYNAPTNTFSASGTNNYTSLVNALNPIDTTNCSIHAIVRRIGTGGMVTGVYIDLFSTGSPSAPGSDYHTLNIVNDLGNGFAKSNGYASRSFGINLFTAVGAGANLSAVTFARIRVTGTSGLVVRPEEIKAVPNLKTKATCIFSFDDFHSSPITFALQTLASYGFPAVIFPSPAENIVGTNGGVNGTLSIDNALNLQHNYGWQIGTQEYLQERTVDLNPEDWINYQSRNFTLGASLGFDADGLRDGSQYGGGPYYVNSEQYKVAPKILASSRRADNGLGSLGDGIAPFYFADTNPPGDPWDMRCLNINSYGSSAGTANNIYLKFKAYVDQAIANKVFASSTVIPTGTRRKSSRQCSSCALTLQQIAHQSR